jgi:hypothetical protein
VHDAGPDPALGGAVLLHLGPAFLPLPLHAPRPVPVRATQPGHAPLSAMPPHDSAGEFLFYQSMCTQKCM